MGFEFLKNITKFYEIQYAFRLRKLLGKMCWFGKLLKES